jgi:hypothetical protein
MYDYEVPDGYGDIFYVYVFNPAANGLVNGQSYSYLPIQIQDGAFVMRAWAGADSVLAGAGAVNTWGTIQLYDPHSRLFYDLPSAVFTNCATGTAVLPEKTYESNSAIRFDLTDVSLAKDATATVPVSQLAFYGVRRMLGAQSDPAEAGYKYKYVDFSIPFQFALAGNGTAAGPGKPTQYTVQIQDYDFELRRMEYSKSATSGYFNVNYAGSGLVFTAPAAGSITFVSSGTPNFFQVTAVGTAVTVTFDPVGIKSVQFAALFNAATATQGIMTATPVGNNVTVVNVPGGPFVVSGGFSTTPGDPVHPEFQMTLYDANWVARSNAPVNCNRLMHYALYSGAALPFNPMNFYPSPPIVYPVNGVIRFDALSLVPVGAANPNPTIYIVFKGARRIPC